MPYARTHCSLHLLVIQGKFLSPWSKWCKSSRELIIVLALGHEEQESGVFNFTPRLLKTTLPYDGLVQYYDRETRVQLWPNDSRRFAIPLSQFQHSDSRYHGGVYTNQWSNLLKRIWMNTAQLLHWTKCHVSICRNEKGFHPMAFMRLNMLDLLKLVQKGVINISSLSYLNLNVWNTTFHSVPEQSKFNATRCTLSRSPHAVLAALRPAHFDIIPSTVFKVLCMSTLPSSFSLTLKSLTALCCRKRWKTRPSL